MSKKIKGLALTIKPGESIKIGDNIIVSANHEQKTFGQLRLVIDGPKELAIVRVKR